MDTVIRAQTRIKDIKRITLKLPRIRCSFPTLFPPFFGVDRSKNLRTNFPKLFPLSLFVSLRSKYRFILFAEFFTSVIEKKAKE